MLLVVFPSLSASVYVPHQYLSGVTHIHGHRTLTHSVRSNTAFYVINLFCYIMSTGSITTYHKLGSIWKRTIVTCFKTLPQHLFGAAEESQ
jgi:hypothetical protein